MKEQWKINKKNLATLEKGLREEKQECKTSCCKKWLRYIRLIFLLEITLFFGWGCYMILETYRARVTKNEVTDITRGRYIPVFGSPFELPSSHQDGETPLILVKSEVILDKLNNFLKDMKLTKTQDLIQDYVITVDVDNVQMQNPIRMQDNNMVKMNDDSLKETPSSRESESRDEKFKNSMSWETTSTDKIINTDKGEEFILSSLLLNRLRNIVNSNDLEKSENGYEDIDRMISDNQENKVLGISNEADSLEFERNVINSLANDLQNFEQRLLDSIKDAAQDDVRDGKSSFDTIDKGINIDLESDLVICPPYQSDESFDMSPERSGKASSIFQAAPTVESSKQIGNASSGNIDAKDEDEQDDNNTPLKQSAFGNDERYISDASVRVSTDTNDQISSERNASAKEDERYEGNVLKLFPEMQDSVETVTSNVDVFQWYNAPAFLADDLFDQSQDVSSETQIFSRDNDRVEAIYPNSQDKCFMDIMMGILRVKCPGIKLEIEEELNLTSSEVNTPYALNTDNFDEIYDDTDYEINWDDLIFENSDEKGATLQPNVSEIIDGSELEEGTPRTDVSNDASLYSFDTTEIDSFDGTEVSQDDTTRSTNEGGIKRAVTIRPTTISESGIIIDPGREWNPLSELSVSGIDTIDIDKEGNPSPTIPISRIPVIDPEEEPNLSTETSDTTQQQERSKITEKQDAENVKTFVENDKIIDASKKELASIFNIEMPRIVNERYAPESLYGQNYIDNICRFYPFMCSSKYTWPQQYDDVRKSFEHLRKDDNNIRKKRMIYLMSQEQISNALEENVDENVNRAIEPEELIKLFKEMNILLFANLIDNEQHLFHNKLDDDYVSREISGEN